LEYIKVEIVKMMSEKAKCLNEKKGLKSTQLSYKELEKREAELDDVKEDKD